MNIKDHVAAIADAFARGLRAILKEKLYGLYIFGAAVFPDNVPTGDVDYHVILTEPLLDIEKDAIDKLHKALARDFPPLGGETDGYYILLSDAIQKANPKSQMWREATDGAWALHREHILAGRCIVIHGPDPSEIYQPSSWNEIELALDHEFKYVEDHLEQHPDYCILQLCRLIYSFKTRDIVVSKAKSAEWAYDEFTQWRKHIDLARKSYGGLATEEDRKFMVAGVSDLFDFAVQQIREFKNETLRSKI